MLLCGLNPSTPLKAIGEAKVSNGERFACWVGVILIGFAGILMLRNEPSTKGRRRGGDEPVEVLAEELKDAWAEYHTP
jgi:hypothetical protein